MKGALNFSVFLLRRPNLMPPPRSICGNVRLVGEKQPQLLCFCGQEKAAVLQRILGLFLCSH